MKRMALIGGVLIISGSLFMGCASKGFVQEEVKKSETTTREELGKQIKNSIDKLEADVSKRITNIESNFATKNEMTSKLYEQEGSFKKYVDSKLEEIVGDLNKIKSMKEETMERLSQNLQSSVNIILTQLKEQKEGIERAIEELEKLINEATSTPSTTPPPKDK